MIGRNLRLLFGASSLLTAELFTNVLFCLQLPSLELELSLLRLQQLQLRADEILDLLAFSCVLVASMANTWGCRLKLPRTIARGEPDPDAV